MTAAGGTGARLVVEQELRRCGWPAARSPAEADLLVTCGTIDEKLAAIVDRTWAAMPVPRARARVPTAAAAVAALRGAQLRLADIGAQRASPRPHAADEQKDGGRDDGADHGHHDHQMGGMEMPAGLRMAERADDRDGLKLDQLHVPLGPVLPHWPAGLVVHTTLQGDVIQHAEVERVVTPVPQHFPFWDEPWLRAAEGEPVTLGEAERRRAAAHLDSLSRLLALAGWDDAAVHARRLRDDLLADAPAGRLQREVVRFAQRVRRARTLRWLTDSLGLFGAAAARAAGVSGPALRADGDVTARYQRWLVEAVDALSHLEDRAPLGRDELEGPRGELGRSAPPSEALVDVLPRLLEGAELGGARLIVASLDPDLDELACRPQREPIHG